MGKRTCCETCKHYDPDTVGDEEGDYEGNESDEPWGKCLRYPPVLMNAKRAFYCTGWEYPKVHSYYFSCGEYKPKTEQGNGAETGTVAHDPANISDKPDGAVANENGKG